MELVTLKQLFQRLGNGGRLLGLDVGSRNIGLAVSDAKCRVASPHSVLYRSNTTTLKNMNRLENLVEEMDITGIVVGYPLELTGFQGKQGAQVKLFAKELQMSGRFNHLAYLYWDERLTSVAVTNVIGSMDISGRQRKNIIDKMSALCILQIAKVLGGFSSCTVLFPKFDNFQLERTVGSTYARRMLKSKQSTFTFM